MTPTFSIITITYNAEKLLENTMQSIFGQTYQHIEYLIIDGASTDGTTSIIEKYAHKLACWVSEPDKGLYDAMNKGLQKATGNYVWFINAGDTLYAPDTVEKIVSSLSAPLLPDVIYGETALVNAQYQFVGMRRLKAPEQLTWKSFKMGMLVCHQSFIVKRTIAPLYNQTYKLSADYDWCIQCLKRSKVIYNTHQILSNFLEEGISSKNRKASLKERFHIMCHYYGIIPVSLRHLWFAVRFYTAKWITGRV